jgi:hypothetical protein
VYPQSLDELSIANIPSKRDSVFSTRIVERTPAIILCLFRFVRLLGSGHQAVAIENLALRLQLEAFRRKRKRPVVTQFDRWFWIGLSRMWSGWRGSLVFVQPDTVVRWQRDRFRRFGSTLSTEDRPERKTTSCR